MTAPTDGIANFAGGYLAMAQVFSYPSPEIWQRLAAQGLVDPACDQTALEADYLAAFELGRSTAAVSLFEGMHRADLGREGILEDVLRFYEFFDVRLSGTDREFPDHLVTELEFLAWLSLQELSAQRLGRDAEPFRNAARDFLSRHLGAWVPVFGRKLEATDTAYAPYGAILADLVTAHRDRLGCQPRDTGGLQ